MALGRMAVSATETHVNDSTHDTKRRRLLMSVGMIGVGGVLVGLPGAAAADAPSNPAEPLPETRAAGA